MATDGALLALIVDDAAAVQVLAAWAALEPDLIAVHDARTVAELSALSGIPVERTAACVKKLLAARVLQDGGITELADKMLQSHVQTRLMQRKRK